MKIFVLAAAFLAFAGPALAADPVAGIWQTLPDDNGNVGQVEVAHCGDRLCGTLIRAFNAQGEPVDSPNIGRRIVWDMVAEGNDRYGGGKVWAPDRDKTYRSKMALDGDTLAVSGCVLGGIICRASQWTRVR